MSRRLLVVPLGLMLCAAGCGVQDYESQMVKAQARVERWETEAKALDAPLVVPSRLGPNKKPISYVTVFVRPPRGIPSSPLNAKEPREGLMYTFRPKAQNVAGAFHSVEVAVGDKANEFRDQVLGCYRPSNTPAHRKRVVNPPGRAPVTFNTYEFDDGALFYSVNLWRGDRDQVAVVYVANLAQKAGASRTIDLSLETFATGTDALKLREITLKGPLEVPGHPSQ